MWLVPPIMNSQITLLARGAKCGCPTSAAEAPNPSRFNMAAKATLPNPSPDWQRKWRLECMFGLPEKRD
jgi:hypothetical protein